MRTAGRSLPWHALRRAFRPVQVALTDEGLNGLGIHLINETVETVRARLSLRCFGDGDTVTMRRERDVELPPRSNQTLSFGGTDRLVLRHHLGLSLRPAAAHLD